MKLLPALLTALLLVPAAVLAQDKDVTLPEGDTNEAAAEALREQGAIGAAQPDDAPGEAEAKAAEAGVEAPGNAESAAAARSEGEAVEAERDAKAELDAQRKAIADEMGLPYQDDIGVDSSNFWMPEAASTQAGDADFLFDFILYVTYFFTALVVVLMTWFLIRYRARSDDEPDPVNVPTHSTTLEITWTVIPTCIVLVFFVLGFRAYLNDTIAPPNAYEVRVTGASWYWSFQYPNGATTSDLHLPKDRPVKFILQSTDVIHSLYIPAFRVKKDVVPGRYNEFWVEPTKEGVFELACTEYCGTSHSEMRGKCFVYDAEKYPVILAEISNIYAEPFTGEARPPAEVGYTIWQVKGCQGCHSISGEAGTGPTWRDLWNQPGHEMADGSVVEVDDNYIRESIYYPNEKYVKGFGGGMSSYAGILDDRDVASVIAYLKTISKHTTGEAQPEPSNQGGQVTPEESTSLDDDTGVGTTGEGGAEIEAAEDAAE